MHDSPLDLQGAAHTPPLQESPLQQSLLALQLDPVLLQVPHLPLMHWVPVQQSLLALQLDPVAPHGFLQVPSLQESPLQHSLE